MKNFNIRLSSCTGGLSVVFDASDPSPAPRTGDCLRRCALPAHSTTWRALLAVCQLSAALARSALAQYAVDWHAVDGGGTSTSGAYSVSGTIGQPDAGPPAHAGLAPAGNLRYSKTKCIWFLASAASRRRTR